VKELHNHWSSGDGVWFAITAGRHFNLVSLGSIAATLIFIDQPLIQKASTVVSTPRTYLTNVTAAIALRFRGATQAISHGGFQKTKC
jgi:hypothetical protein